jgi:tetratricopeptide (TPR) repeat protein
MGRLQLSFFCLLLLLGGCTATPTAPSTRAPATASTSTAEPQPVDADVPLDEVRPRSEPPAADPERSRRAREIYLRGVRLLAAGQPHVDEAIREFKLALEIDPLFYRAHFKLGICYYQKGMYAYEINEYKKCIAIEPKYVPGWLNLGHAHLARDELEQARDAYDRVLDLEPNHAVALYNLALVQFDLRNEQASRQLFRSFLEVDGEGDMGKRAREYLSELDRRLSTSSTNGGS